MRWKTGVYGRTIDLIVKVRAFSTERWCLGIGRGRGPPPAITEVWSTPPWASRWCREVWGSPPTLVIMIAWGGHYHAVMMPFFFFTQWELESTAHFIFEKMESTRWSTTKNNRHRSHKIFDPSRASGAALPWSRCVGLQVSFALSFWASSGDTCATSASMTLRTEQTADS